VLIPGWRQVEGVEVLGGGAGQSHVLALDGGAQGAVLVLRVDDQEVDARQEVPKGHQLGEVALAGARPGEDDHVGVLEALVEGIEEDRRVVVFGDAIENSPLHRQCARREGEHRRQRAGVQVAVDEQAVLALGQA